MGMTSNWKKLNMFNYFYQNAVLDSAVGSNWQLIDLPLTVKCDDGTNLIPRVGFNNTDYYCGTYNMYGQILDVDRDESKAVWLIGSFKVAIGSGDTPFSEDDYCLENEIANNYDSTSLPEKATKNCCLYFNGITDDASVNIEIAGINNTANIWTINEIGIFTRVARPNTPDKGDQSSSSIPKKYCLILREVLQTPVIVEPGKQYSIQFKVKALEV